MSVESLIRQLAAHAQIASDDGSHATSNSQAEVLIDTEVDGVRCVLVRKNEHRVPQVSFSPREREIARMVSIGHPNKTIAAVLEISSWTVCTHLRRIFAKLGVSSRAAMVARMIEQGSMSILLVYASIIST
jgi:DNA-binding CsgD family transcriptional regulator